MVVIGVSARMLAVSAKRAGFDPIAIDLFADQDTRAVARCIPLPALEERAVLHAVASVVAEIGRTYLVYGGGIDTHPDWVERIADLADLAGNPPQTLRMMHEPASFFGLLDSLSIPYPETRFSHPQDPDAWLCKIPFTEGGSGVLPGRTRADLRGGYYQKKIEGPSMSVLFLADRREANIVGFNTQWSAAPPAPSPYLFSGIMNSADLSVQQRKQIAVYVTRLVKSASLVGLNSLDFLMERGECRVLELNPRPGTSVSLYDDLFPFGLVAEHIRAFQGCRVAGPHREFPGIRGLEIVYAERPCRIVEDVAWPEWTVDRPMPGTRVPTHAPICTVTGRAATRGALRRLLTHRRRTIQDFFLPVAKDNL
jgi:uncharacterized protein